MSRLGRRTIGALGVILATAVMSSGTALAAAPYAPPGTKTKPTALKRFDDGLALGWVFGPKTTKLHSAKLGVAGPDVTLIALYLKPGKHHATLLWQLTADGQSEIVTALAALERRTYTAGDKLQLTLADPGTLPQQATFSFRRNQLPSTRVAHPRPLPHT
jgi:hypothetical protein